MRRNRGSKGLTVGESRTITDTTTIKLIELHEAWRRAEATGKPDVIDAAFHALRAALAAEAEDTPDPQAELRVKLAAVPHMDDDRPDPNAIREIWREWRRNHPDAMTARQSPLRSPSGEIKPLEGATWEMDSYIPPRRWLIPGWLPLGRLVSLYGTGAVGKSRLMQQVAAGLLTGTVPLAIDPGLSNNDKIKLQNDHPGLLRRRKDAEPLRALWLTWEDEVDEIRRRWRMAHEAGAVTTFDPDPEKITIVNMREYGAQLWAPGEGSYAAAQATWTEAERLQSY